MGQYRKKPVEVEATQWFKNGDHPEDGVYGVYGVYESDVPAPEGAVVRYFRDPGKDSHDVCTQCHRIWHKHGWIDTLEGGLIVCPGDWIITGVKNEKYPCNPDIFALTYEEVEGLPDD